MLTTLLGYTQYLISHACVHRSVCTSLPLFWPQLRVKQVASGTASKLAQIKVARKNIARCLTVYNAKRRSEERAKYGAGALAPKTLRVKQTRAKRRELTAEQASKTVRRIAHRAANFPVRNYAVLA